MQWNWDAEKTARWLKPAVEIPWLSERWREKGFHTLLDNGCGPGRHAVYFAGKGFAVTGFDQSPEALAYLKDWAMREGRPLQTVQGDIFHMPFPAGAFDCILDYNVSYHTDTQGFRLALSELHRVLRPGGELYMTLLSQNDPGFQGAPPEAHLDAYTLAHDGGTPHFYGKRADLPEIFAGFSLAEPLREIRAAGLDSKKESIHYHLLLKREAL